MSYAAANIVDFIRGFGQRATQAKVNDAEKNYLTDPDGTIKAVQQISAPAGIALNAQHLSDQDDAASAAANTAKANNTKVTNGIAFMRGLPAGTQPGDFIDQNAGLLKSTLGYSDSDINGLKTLVQSNPGVIRGLDPDAHKEDETDHVLTGGAMLTHGLKPVIQNGTQPKPMQVGSDAAGRQVVSVGGSPTVQFDANGQPIAPTASADPAAQAPATDPSLPLQAVGAPPTIAGVDPYKPLLKREAGTNPNGTGRTSNAGAEGAGQIMPATGPEAAQAAGEVWDRERNMNDPEYSAKLGRAYHAVQIARFGGDLPKANAAYNAGPGRVIAATGVSPGAKAGWLAKLPAETRAYVQATAPGAFPSGTAVKPGVVTPQGAPAAGGGTQVLYSTPPVAKPARVSYRAATPDEIKSAGYPEGTAAQIDSDGKLVNLKEPAAGAAGKPGAAKGDPVSAYSNARTDLMNLRHSLVELAGDPNVPGSKGSPDLGSATGMYGAITQHIPGSSAANIHAKIQAAKGLALNSAVASLKNAGGGNLGFRMTQAEAQAFGNSLAGPIENTNQSPEDYAANVQAGIRRIDSKLQEMDGGAARSGVAAHLPNGHIILKGDVYKGHVYTGGDPSQPTSWKAQ